MSCKIEEDNPEWKTMSQGPEWRECSMFVLNKLEAIDKATGKILESMTDHKIEMAVIKTKARIAGGVTSAILLAGVELVKHIFK